MKQIIAAITINEEIKSAITKYSKDHKTKQSVWMRGLIVAFLIQNGYLSSMETAKINAGAGSWANKFIDATSEKRQEMMNHLVEQAAHARKSSPRGRLKKIAMTISGNTQGAGSVISGADCTVHIDNSQKNFPLK